MAFPISRAQRHPFIRVPWGAVWKKSRNFPIYGNCRVNDGRIWSVPAQLDFIYNRGIQHKARTRSVDHGGVQKHAHLKSSDSSLREVGLRINRVLCCFPGLFVLSLSFSFHTGFFVNFTAPLLTRESHHSSGTDPSIGRDFAQCTQFLRHARARLLAQCWLQLPRCVSVYV